MWTQNYDPMGNWPLSTLVASVPVLVLLGLLASGKASAWGAALAGLGAAMVAAIWVFKMPSGLVIAASGHGVVFAAFRIVWLIVAAVFLYDIAVATGQFDVMKASIARLSGDRRVQAVLVAFSFGRSWRVPRVSARRWRSRRRSWWAWDSSRSRPRSFV